MAFSLADPKSLVSQPHAIKHICYLFPLDLFGKAIFCLMLNVLCFQLGPNLVTAGSQSDQQREWVFLHCNGHAVVSFGASWISKYNKVKVDSIIFYT